MKKRKNLKRIVAFILMAVMLLNLQTMNVSAAKKDKNPKPNKPGQIVEDVISSGTCGQNATWKLNETKGILTISGTGAMTDYSSGSSPWYQKRQSVKEIVVEDGITHVGNYAFSYTIYCKSVKLANTVTSVGSNAFLANYDLTELSMPGVEIIGDHGFSNCRSLASFQWPEKLREIGAYAFWCCAKLQSPVFTENLVHIGESAFAACNSIESVTIPASLTKIDYYAFDLCEGLKSVTFADGAVTMNGYMFRGCSSLEEVILPDGLTAIPPYAFADCVSLRWIWIPDSVTSIGPSAFEASSGITRIAIPGSVKSIGHGAFYHCLNLQSAIYFGSEAEWKNVAVSGYNQPLLDVLTEYDDHNYVSFEYKDRGSCVKPKVLNYIADDGSQRVERIPALGHQYKNDICTVCGAAYVSDEELLGHGFCTADIEWKLTKDGTLTISGTGEMPNYGVRTEAPWYDFHDKVLRAVVEEGITYLGEEAFSYCLKMTELTLPDSMTEIGAEACSACYVLKDVKLPANLKKIGSNAFSGCYSIPEIEFPDTLEVVGEYAFYNCKALKELNLPASVHTIEQWAFPYCDGLTSVTLPEGLKSLGDYAFDSCENLKSVSLPESLTYLGIYAFRGCSSLTSFNIPSQITVIGQNTFDDCDALTVVELPENVKQLNWCAFYNCDNLTDVVIAAEDCKIGAGVFEKCSPNLTIWGVPGSVVETYASANALKFKDIANYSKPEQKPEPEPEPEPEPDPKPEYKLEITAQPQNQTAKNKGTAVFQVKADGSNLTYQWQTTDKKGSWNNISGEKKDTLTLTCNKKMSGYQYRCVITDGKGNSVTSEYAVLTVK